MARLYCKSGKHYPPVTLATGIPDCELGVQCDNKGDATGFREDGVRGVSEEDATWASEDETKYCFDAACPGYLEECDWDHKVSDEEADKKAVPEPLATDTATRPISQIHEAVGPCPVCGKTKLWLNDVPLKGFCWGTEEAPHEEYSKLVPAPYNPYLDAEGNEL